MILSANLCNQVMALAEQVQRAKRVRKANQAHDDTGKTTSDDHYTLSITTCKSPGPIFMSNAGAWLSPLVWLQNRKATYANR